MNAKNDQDRVTDGYIWMNVYISDPDPDLDPDLGTPKGRRR